MGDYERSIAVQMPVDDLFEFLSKVENLPRYMSHIIGAHPATGDVVEVEARLDPADLPDDPGTSARTVHGQAWFRIDADHRRLEWGSPGPHDYWGELQVAARGDGSAVAVRLHTMHDDLDAVEHGLAETLANIQHLADGDLR